MYDQEDIITNGYLGFKKIGDMLPYDYKPDLKAPNPDGE